MQENRGHGAEDGVRDGLPSFFYSGKNLQWSIELVSSSPRNMQNYGEFQVVERSHAPRKVNYRESKRVGTVRRLSQRPSVRRIITDSMEWLTIVPRLRLRGR